MHHIDYAPFGPVRRWIWGNYSDDARPNTYARAFDLDGRINNYPLGDIAANGLLRTISYDAAGRIEAMSHTGGGAGALAATFNQSYGYDNLDRLISFVGSGTTQYFAYDANGNRIQAGFGASSYINTMSPTSNRLDSSTGPGQAKSNTYDAAGNLTSDGAAVYTYSDRGRLQRVVNGGATVSYLYNGVGQRVAKNDTSVASGANFYIYDEQGHLLGEYDRGGAALQETVFLGDIPVVILNTRRLAKRSDPVPDQKQDRLVTSSSITSISYVYADHLNTPRVITSAATGNVVWRWDGADPFGLFHPNENPNGAGAFTYNSRFPGQVFDKETNNHYNYFRDYDPQVGRYVQSDPIGLGGGINTYGYGFGNPNSNTDPKGLFVPLIIPGICAAGGCEALFGAATGAAVWWGLNSDPKATSVVRHK